MLQIFNTDGDALAVLPSEEESVVRRPVSNAYLRGALIRGYDLRRIDFRDCNLRDASIIDATLTDLSFENCDMRGVRVSNSNLTRLLVSDSKLDILFLNSTIKECRVSETEDAKVMSYGTAAQDLTINCKKIDVVFEEGSIQGCTIAVDRLKDSRIISSKIESTEFKYCDFGGADFFGTTFRRCLFSHCNAEEAKFRNADLRETELPSRLHNAIFDVTTQFSSLTTWLRFVTPGEWVGKFLTSAICVGLLLAMIGVDRPFAWFALVSLLSPPITIVAVYLSRRPYDLSQPLRTFDERAVHRMAEWDSHLRGRADHLLSRATADSPPDATDDSLSATGGLPQVPTT